VLDPLDSGAYPRRSANEMKKLKQLFGIESSDEKIERLPQEMPDDEKKLITKIIEEFIAGAGGPYDWDWMITGPKESKEGELITYFCSSLDFVYPAEKKGHFCSPEGIQKLSELLAVIKNNEAESRSTFDFLQDFKQKADPDATGQRR